MKYRLHYLATCLFIAMSFISCSDDEVISNQPIPEQPEQLTELIAQYNTNISAYQAMIIKRRLLIISLIVKASINCNLAINRL